MHSVREGTVLATSEYSEHDSSKEPSSRERIHELDKSLSLSQQLQDQRHEENRRKLDEILGVTRSTNGRVSRLERWQDRIIGALVIIMLVLMPVAGYLLKTWADGVLRGR
jgi:hypothetical protein